MSESRSVVSDSLWPHGLYSPRNSPVQNTGVTSLSLLQGIFPAQGSNSDLLHCRQILYQLSHKGSPRILECVAQPFSRGSSWPRNRTRVSCTASGKIMVWREAGCGKWYRVQRVWPHPGDPGPHQQPWLQVGSVDSWHRGMKPMLRLTAWTLIQRWNWCFMIFIPQSQTQPNRGQQSNKFQ